MKETRHMQTWSGKKFYFLSPDPSSILIEDIAHSLSLQCRFNGHCSKHYSVAEHSLKAVEMAINQYPGNVRLALTVLLHDAAEAYIGDIVSPLKEMLPDFREIESRVEACISDKFGLIFPFPKEVKVIDSAVLREEFLTVYPFSDSEAKWNPLSYEEAERDFLAMFYNLHGAILVNDKS